MLSKDIEIGERYAYKRRGGELVTFHVTSVGSVRTRKGGNARGYVHGFIVEDTVEDDRAEPLQLEPADLLGPIKEHQELVQRELAAKAIAKAREDAENEALAETRRVLYRFVAMPLPNDDRDHKQMFRQGWSEIRISKEGSDLLREALKKFIT
jgi:hypothetical protein